MLTGNSCSLVQLEGLKQLIQPNSGWRPNFATQLRASAMQQLRGDKLAMKGALDLILWCAYGNKSRAFPGAPLAAFLPTCSSPVGRQTGYAGCAKALLTRDRDKSRAFGVCLLSGLHALWSCYAQHALKL